MCGCGGELSDCRACGDDYCDDCGCFGNCQDERDLDDDIEEQK